QGHHIGAPPIEQRQFGEAGVAVGAEHSPKTARNELRRLRLAPVDDARRLQRRGRRLCKALGAHRRASTRIIAATFSAIIRTGELVLPEVMRGMTEASAMRKPLSPRTFSRASTTAPRSSSVPILAVP